jgi:hypothetical protein
MLPKTPSYEGGPDITSPLSANKVDGLSAHIRDAVEQRPLAAFSAEGVGKTAEEASMIAPMCEAYMEREINQSGSRELLASDMAKEAAQVGTAIAEISVTEIGDEMFVQFGKVIRLENFYVDRIFARNLKDVFCFYEFKERHYNLQDMADYGIYDSDAVKSLTQIPSSSNDAISSEEETYLFNESSSFSEENSLRTLIKGYFRFRPKGESKALIYEFVMDDGTKTYLSIRRNPFSAAFDAPPLTLFRIGKQAGYLFGTGIVRRLANEQKIADKYLNNHLALTDIQSTPPYLYRANSAFGNALERSGKRGIFPGQAIPVMGQPNVRDVEMLQLTPGTGNNLQNVEIANRFADMATFPEGAIGSDSSGRKTLGQFQIEVQNGTLRLRADMADFAYDAAMALRMYWASIVAFKIDPGGIVEIYEGGKLLASEPISPENMSKYVAEAVRPLASTGQVDESTLVSFQSYFNDLLTNGGVPGVKRNDLTISLSGTRVIADKVAELQLQFQLLPTALQLFEYAKQDSYANYWLRSIITSSGFKDVDKRVPADPGATVDEAKRAQLALPYQQLLATSSNLV